MRKGLERPAAVARVRNSVPLLPHRPAAPRITTAMVTPCAMMTNRRALLDVSVLIALFHPDHVHHESLTTGSSTSCQPGLLPNR